MKNDTKLLFKCWTKATSAEVGDPRYSLNWVTSRRAWLKIFDGFIQCGNWKIDFASIKEATLYKAKWWFFIPVYILKVVTDTQTYQFGINPWCPIKTKIPFPYKEESIKLKYSPFSLAVRIFLLAYLVYLIVEYIRS